MPIISSSMKTLSDFNDAIISVTEPPNPSVGTLWLDQSNPQYPAIKRWSGSAWVVIGDLTPDLKGKFDAINTQLSNFTDDNKIDFKERQMIKQWLTDIIGFVIADATTVMPTSSALDSSRKGDFYKVRANAISAGIAVTDTLYIAVATKYTDLKTYLEALTPIDVWNISSTSKDVVINVTKATFRDKWLQLYTAMDDLEVATADSLKKYVQSRGENLVTNGTGLLGNNTNFSGWTFDASQVFAGGGSFSTTNQNSTKFNDEQIPVDGSQTYRFSLMAKSLTGLGHNYFGVMCQDIDGLDIGYNHVAGATMALTTLAQPLKAGDTKVYLTSTTGFIDNQPAATEYQHSLLLWGYTNKKGYTYPTQTYSRYTIRAGWDIGGIDRTNNVITLRTPFSMRDHSGAEITFPAGHPVSPTTDGGSYQYITASNVKVSKDNWQKFEGTIGGYGNVNSTFRHGTAFIKLLFLVNRSSSGGTAGDNLWINALEFLNITAEQKAITYTDGKVSTINTTLTNITTDSIIDVTERRKVKEELMEIIGYVISDTATAMPTTATLDTSKKGNFYAVRQKALNAGITTTDPAYVLVTTQYNSLKTYLDALGTKPWDASEANKNSITSIDKNVFRDKFMQFYLAVQALEVLANNVPVGGRNLLRDSTFNIRMKGVASWQQAPASYFEYIQPENDKPSSSIHRITSTSTTDLFIQNYNANAIDLSLYAGKEITVSFDFKATTAPTSTGTAIMSARTYDNANSVGSGTGFVSNYFISYGTAGPTIGVWKRVSYTFKPTGATEKFLRITPYMARDGVFLFREIKVEAGRLPTDWTPAPEDNEDINVLTEQRIVDVERNITEEAIVSKVTASTYYQEQMAAKADTEALGAYATSEDLEAAKTALENSTNAKISGIDFTPYVLSSDLTQTEKNIMATFSGSGGANMLKNSVGYADTDFWSLTGSMGTTQNDELDLMGSGSGWTTPVGSGGYIDQEVYTTPEQPYSIQFSLKKDDTGNAAASAKIEIFDADNVLIKALGRDSNQGYTDGYEQFQHTFIATTTKIKIRLYISTEAQAIFTDIMLNYGALSRPWSMATGENYNTNVKLDKNGIQVQQLDEDQNVVGLTVMTPDKFAGYYDVNKDGVIDRAKGSADEVFRIDQDEFVMKKATVRNEITMGTLKVTQYNSSAFSGWAFTANKTTL